MAYCEDEALFFEERFDAHLEFDLVLESAPVCDDWVLVSFYDEIIVSGGWACLTGRQVRPPSTGPPILGITAMTQRRLLGVMR